MEPSKTLLGFVGLGNMGFPMAANLAKAGAELIVYDVSPEAMSRFTQAHGGRAADEPAKLAGADVLILMLPNGKIVREFLVGAQGIAPLLAKGTIIVDMSSSAAEGTERLGADLAAMGVRLIDAPVSGGVPRARTGKLAIMAGGDEATLEEVRPLLEVLSSSITYVGKLGAGHAMKALNNYVSAAGLVAACEALRVAEHFGIDGARAIEVMNSSTGRNNSTENKLGQYVLPQTYNSGFSLALMRKDLAAALDLADALKMQLPLGHYLLEIWEKAEHELEAGADHTAIDRLVKAGE